MPQNDAIRAKALLRVARLLSEQARAMDQRPETRNPFMALLQMILRGGDMGLSGKADLSGAFRDLGGLTGRAEVQGVNIPESVRLLFTPGTATTTMTTGPSEFTVPFLTRQVRRGTR